MSPLTIGIGLILVLLTSTFGSENLSVLYEGIRDLKKSELHLHLGGSYPLAFLESIATSSQMKELSQYLEMINQDNLLNYHEAFKVFPLIGNIVDTEFKVSQGMEWLCYDLLKENIVYAEIRTGLKDYGNGFESYLLSLLSAIDMAQVNVAKQIGMSKSQVVKEVFNAKLILSIRRNTPIEDVRKTVDLAIKYAGRGVVGIDISGDSILGEGEEHYRQVVTEVRKVKEMKDNLGVVLHIGETFEEQQQLQEILDFQPDRIGHGVCLSEDARLHILEKGIPVEVCLTSAYMAKMLKTRQDVHPWLLEYFRNGHPISIATDDPLVFNVNLSHELFYAARILGYTKAEELQDLTQRAACMRLDMMVKNQCAKI